MYNALKDSEVSTHSRPKAAGREPLEQKATLWLFQHTAARRRLVCHQYKHLAWKSWFQHTAARRRLGYQQCETTSFKQSFNTQPPEGGWQQQMLLQMIIIQFQHTAARRRLVSV